MTSDVLYGRLLLFAKDSQTLVKKLPRNTYNIEYSSQLIRSSSSPGANYIEAIEASSKNEFIYRLYVCKKELRESIHWLLLIKHANDDLLDTVHKIDDLINEVKELIKIYSSSIDTAKKKQNAVKLKMINEK